MTKLVDIILGRNKSENLEQKILSEIYNAPKEEQLQFTWYQKKESFRELLEYFGLGNVPVNILKEFRKDPYTYKDYILENLQTHNWRQMAKALMSNPNFGLYITGITSFNVVSKDDKQTVFVDLEGTKKHPTEQLLEELPKDPEFIKILEFYGYGFSQIAGVSIILEPKYTESASEYVYTDCFGYGYHITTKRNAERIERTGIRTKNGYPDSGDSKNYKPYREFPNRIYFFATPPMKGSEMKDYMLNKATKKHISRENVAVFKIKLSGNVYRDTSMLDSDAFFTYTNIPPECLTRIV